MRVRSGSRHYGSSDPPSTTVPAPVGRGSLFRPPQLDLRFISPAGLSGVPPFRPSPEVHPVRPGPPPSPCAWSDRGLSWRSSLYSNTGSASRSMSSDYTETRTPLSSPTPPVRGSRWLSGTHRLDVSPTTRVSLPPPPTQRALGCLVWDGVPPWMETGGHDVPLWSFLVFLLLLLSPSSSASLLSPVFYCPKSLLSTRVSVVPLSEPAVPGGRESRRVSESGTLCVVVRGGWNYSTNNWVNHFQKKTCARASRPPLFWSNGPRTLFGAPGSPLVARLCRRTDRSRTDPSGFRRESSV